MLEAHIKAFRGDGAVISYRGDLYKVQLFSPAFNELSAKWAEANFNSDGMAEAIVNAAAFEMASSQSADLICSEVGLVSKSVSRIFVGIMSSLSARMASLDGGDAYANGRRLILNRPWVQQAHDFVCPTCLRSKPDLLFRDGNGDWRGELVVHHDHCVDEFGDFLLVMGVAFQNSIICTDCNILEGKPKAKGLIPKWFSFDAVQLSELIYLVDGEPDIDIDRAVCLYKDVSEEKRSAIQAAKEVWDYSQKLRATALDYRPNLGSEEFYLDVMQSERYQNLEELTCRLQRTASGLGAGWYLGEVPSRRKFRVPSEIEIAEALRLFDFEFPNESGAPISTWACACCQRLAKECVRFYPKSKKVRLKTSSVYLGGKDKLDSCYDCKVAVSAIFGRNPSLDSAVLFDACRQVVEALPNQPPYIDEKKVLSLAENTDSGCHDAGLKGESSNIDNLVFDFSWN